MFCFAECVSLFCRYDLALSRVILFGSILYTDIAAHDQALRWGMPSHGLRPNFCGGFDTENLNPNGCQGGGIYIYTCVYILYIHYIHVCSNTLMLDTFWSSSQTDAVCLGALWIEKQQTKSTTGVNSDLPNKKTRKTYLHLPKGAVRTLRDVV